MLFLALTMTLHIDMKCCNHHLPGQVVKGQDGRSRRKCVEMDNLQTASREKNQDMQYISESKLQYLDDFIMTGFPHMDKNTTSFAMGSRVCKGKAKKGN